MMCVYHSVAQEANLLMQTYYTRLFSPCQLALKQGINKRSGQQWFLNYMAGKRTAFVHWQHAWQEQKATLSANSFIHDFRFNYSH